MQRSSLLPFLLLAFVATAHADKPRKPKPPLPAQQYPFHETHEKEHVTIAAEPGDSREAEPDTRLDYYHHGFMPMRVIVTNDSDQPLTLDEARIHFVAADNTVVLAATDEELQRRMFEMKSATGTKIPMPMPLPPITIHHKPVDKQILADDNDFGFKTTTVAPHTTVAGYLFYDTRDVDDPILLGATLELRKVRFARGGPYLDTFDILLKPASDPNKPGDDKTPLVK